MSSPRAAISRNALAPKRVEIRSSTGRAFRLIRFVCVEAANLNAPLPTVNRPDSSSFSTNSNSSKVFIKRHAVARLISIVLASSGIVWGRGDLAKRSSMASARSTD